MLARNEADLGLALLRISEERTLVADFSRHYSVTGHTFVGKNPENLAPIFAIVYPFDAAIWIGICITIVALSVFSYVLGGECSFWKLLSSVLKQPFQLGDGSQKWRYYYSFYFC